ncbi:MAG: hypothetical protein K5850_08860 [Bacteroidales bacterium]|nr:hypothetical protein [Bacteroidales bacterium]
MENKLSYKLDIPCYMFDNRSLLRASSFMDIAQELATQGSFQLGFSDRQMAPHNIVWILARMRVRFNTLPPMYSTVTAQTWHRGLKGMCYVRDYQLLGDNGESLVDATSSWIIMEKTKRTIVRPNALEGIVDSAAQNDAFAIEEPAARILLPKDSPLEAVGEHRVIYSDLDCNGHTNNAKYTVWAMDCLPGDLTRSHNIKDITINFNHEALFGETVTLYHAQNGNEHIVEGRCADSQIFISKLIFD